MKVLIADDEKSFCDVLEDVLLLEGYEVFRAYDGKETLEKLYTVSPDLMILDVSMPVINGYEVCERVRRDKIYGNMPVFMITGKGIEGRNRSIAAGTNEYITKPFDIYVLLLKIKAILNLVRS